MHANCTLIDDPLYVGVVKFVPVSLEHRSTHSFSLILHYNKLLCGTIVKLTFRCYLGCEGDDFRSKVEKSTNTNKVYTVVVNVTK